MAKVSGKQQVQSPSGNILLLLRITNNSEWNDTLAWWGVDGEVEKRKVGVLEWGEARMWLERDIRGKYNILERGNKGLLGKGQ